jgi:hypothetical protein
MTSQVAYIGLQHMGGSISHVWQGFISSENADLFFVDVSKTTFKGIINVFLTIIGDAILVSSSILCI